MKTYTIRKCKKILNLLKEREAKKRSHLSTHDQKELDHILSQLVGSIANKDREKATAEAMRAELFYERHFKKTFFEWLGEFSLAITVALIAATIIRQSWFELYEIPSGSMRPTFLEQDRLTVTKTQFGINIPLKTDHFIFDPSLVKRTGPIIFTADGLPNTDTDTTYFWLFPAKKRFVKRQMGLPGDTLYFYGGKIYGLDKEGKPIPEFLDAPWMKTIESVPFLSFQGKEHQFKNEGIELYQFHLPVARIEFTSWGEANGFVWNGKEWVTDEPTKKAHSKIETYSDLFGIKNFAMLKIGEKDGKLQLEINHTPSLKQPRFIQDRLAIHIEKSYLPLDQEHLNRLLEKLVTSRFTVSNGKARAWGTSPSSYNIALPGVPDGTYEFETGKAYSIDFTGWRHALADDHPLYKKDPKQIVQLYNNGIEWDVRMMEPSRYGYFRDGDLYLMGSPIFKKDEAALKDFISSEEKKEFPFVDNGPPTKEMIETFGLKIPEKQYLMLGDNHAMSGDSRVFGFVPEENIQGRPSFNLWPPGARWGYNPETPYAIFTLPRFIIWVIAALGFLAWTLWSKRKKR